MTPTMMIFLLLVGYGLFLFGLGWELAVHQHRRRQQHLTREINDLEARVESVNDEMKRDPLRAGIDMGKRHALNAMEATLRGMRRAMGDDE